MICQKLEQTVADNARLERELQQLRRALQARRAAPQMSHAAQPTALLEDGESENLIIILLRRKGFCICRACVCTYYPSTYVYRKATLLV